MALLLAPYNDSMRLGMGFNSYTQTIAIDRAVEVTDQRKVRADNTSQIVTYSSRFVEQLSEIVTSMNISYSTSIKKGTVEVAGSGNTINEEKIKASDLNAVISVKVVNQTTILTDNCTFKPLQGIEPGSPAFNEAFGDCYISGFIEGGDFNGIISIRALDRTKTEDVATKIKRSVTGGKGNEFTLDAEVFSSSSSTSEALKDTETTFSVSWMGGGQVKGEEQQWDIDLVFAAAAAFPAKVAKCPQRTWAILTKYKANRSFQAYAASKSFTSLEYDSVMTFTAELFENFMEYKSLIKVVQDIIVNRDKYKSCSAISCIWMTLTIDLAQVQKPNAISTEISTLVAVKAAFRGEMGKIVRVVDILAKYPNLLKDSGSQTQSSTDPTVLSILQAAIGGKSKVNEAGTSTTASASTATDTSTPVQSSASGSSQELLKLAINSLVAPEVWSDLLPLPASDTAVESSAEPRSVQDFMSLLPPAPTTDGIAPGASSRPSGALYDSTILLSSDEASKIDTLQKSRPGIGDKFRLSQAYGSEVQGSYFNNLSLIQPGFMIDSVGVEISDGAVVLLRVRYTNGLTLTNGRSAGKAMMESPSMARDERIISACFQLGQSTSVPGQSRLLSLMLITNRGQRFYAQVADHRFVGASTWRRDGVDFRKVEEFTITCPIAGGGLVGFWGRSEDSSAASGAAGLWRIGMVWSDSISPPIISTLPAAPTTTTTSTILPETSRCAVVAAQSGRDTAITLTPTFQTAKASIPRIISGVSYMWSRTNVPFRANWSIFDVTTTGFKTTGTYDNARAGDWYFDFEWMLLPDNIPTLQNGKQNLNTITSNPGLVTVNFPKAYSNIPEVHCWFMSINLDQFSARIRAKCTVRSIQRESFTIQLDGNGLCPISSADVGWIAWDAAVEGLRIRGGTITTDTANAGRNKFINWPGGSWAQGPSVMTAMSEFDQSTSFAGGVMLCGNTRRSTDIAPQDKDRYNYDLGSNDSPPERASNTWIAIAR